MITVAELMAGKRPLEVRSAGKGSKGDRWYAWASDGKEMNWIEQEFWRVENGRLAEQWSVADGLDIS